MSDPPPGSGFENNLTDPPVHIAHRSYCAVEQPGFVPKIGGPNQCNCDFGFRLARHLGFDYAPNRRRPALWRRIVRAVRDWLCGE